MKTFITIPTYNEAPTIGSLIEQILGLGLADLGILVIDDSSTDGTREVVTQLAQAHPSVKLVERLDHYRGKATASLVGFDLALQLGADQIVEMDGDFSHNPQDIPQLLAALQDSEISIGSRLVMGGMDLRPKAKRVFSFFTNFYIRVALERRSHRSVVNDWTSRFRAYRREVLVKIPPFTLLPGSDALGQELLFRALNAGMRVKELPIQMVSRPSGCSGLDFMEGVHCFLSVLAYAILYRFRNMDFSLGHLQAKVVDQSSYQVTSIEASADPAHAPRIQISS
ncbi:MAG: glycosyltransferase [Bdellovibrionia bacterium]